MQTTVASATARTVDRQQSTTLYNAMLDPRTEKTLGTLHEKVQSKFRAFMEEAQRAAAKKGLEYKAISGLRTFDEQAHLYAKGRTAPGLIVTNARPGSSYHNYGLAIDCGVFRGGKYLDESEPKTANAFHAEAGKLCGQYGLTWGGSFKSIVDTPHFEFSAGLPILTLLERHNKGEEIL